MVAPFKTQGNIIIDDVGSTCFLKYGVRDYLDYLRSFSLAEFKEDSIWNIFEEFFD